MKGTTCAFPKVLPGTGGYTYYHGLNTRDYIAIQVLQGIAANPAYTETSDEHAAIMAYNYADALIRQSEVNGEQ